MNCLQSGIYDKIIVQIVLLHIEPKHVHQQCNSIVYFLLTIVWFYCLKQTAKIAMNLSHGDFL